LRGITQLPTASAKDSPQSCFSAFKIASQPLISSFKCSKQDEQDFQQDLQDKQCLKLFSQILILFILKKILHILFQNFCFNSGTIVAHQNWLTI
jgi:hypothetical protein